jgi:hypothetical protein
LACNLGTEGAEIPRQNERLLFASAEAAGHAAQAGRIEPYSTIAVLWPQ